MFIPFHADQVFIRATSLVVIAFPLEKRFKK